MQHSLEIFLTKIVDTDILYKQVKIDITTKTENPDDLVLLAVQKYNEEIIEKNRIISHSTSWRYVEGGETIITYVVYSDDFDFTANESSTLSIEDIKIIDSGDVARPAPKVIPLENVISHGIRHLAYLVTNNPSIYQSVLTQNTLLRFKEIDTALAGKI
jgi:hypothetical protein